MDRLLWTSLLLAAPLLASAQFSPPSSGGSPSSGGNPYSNGGDGSAPPSGLDYSQFGPPATVNRMITAHAILATVAFGLLFPSGSILIRLGSFRGLWLVHGIFQLVTYVFYIAASAIGIYMATHLNLMSHSHPTIGTLLLLLLFFQPFLGFVHHSAFKKHNRRVFWSHAHVWLGRFVITLGIINGGLGLQLSAKLGAFAPEQSTIIGYSVAAGVIWLIYVASAIYGESKRRKASRGPLNAPPPNKNERSDGGESGAVQYA